MGLVWIEWLLTLFPIVGFAPAANFRSPPDIRAVSVDASAARIPTPGWLLTSASPVRRYATRPTDRRDAPTPHAGSA